MTRRPATRRTRVMSVLPAALSLTAVLVLPGCYRLAPLETDTPDRGSEVRLALTDAGSVQMASLVGPRVEALEGRTLEVSDSSVVLAVSSTFDRTGIERPWSNERVSVPLGAVGAIHQRELDRRKTWIVSGASVVGLFLVSRAMGLGQGEARVPKGDGGNVQK